MEREAGGFGASAEGAGKKAANSAPSNYSREPARTGGIDCFLLPVMAGDVMRCVQGPWLGWCLSGGNKESFIKREKSPGFNPAGALFR